MFAQRSRLIDPQFTFEMSRNWFEPEAYEHVQVDSWPSEPQSYNVSQQSHTISACQVVFLSARSGESLN